MECLVIVRAEGPESFSAQAAAVPELRDVAPTELEAIEKVSRSLAEWLGSGRLVRVQVPAEPGGNPWLDTFGRSADDPDFDEFLDEIRRARAVGGE